MKIKCVLVLILFLGMSVLSCGKGENSVPSSAPPKPTVKSIVVVTNYPLQFMAQQIAGNVVDLRYPVPDDQDPAYWKPDADAVALMQQADLILINGAGHEPWLDTITLDESKLLDTSKAFVDQFIMVKDALVHSHGPEGKHAHEGVAFTVWLDPQLALRQALAIEVALTKLLPAHSQDFVARFEILKEQFLELDAKLDAFTAGYKQQPVLASHPVYQYLQRRCKLNLESVHWEPDVAPDDPAWAEFDALTTRHPAKWMIWEDEPTPETRADLAKRGIKILVINPCAKPPVDMDFIKVMSDNFDQLLRITAPEI